MSSLKMMEHTQKIKMEKENRSLRLKLMSFQTWMEEQVTLGLMDIEKTPTGFDRSKVKLKEVENRTIGSHCHWCSHKFEPHEKKETANHIMFFHPGCMQAYDKMEMRTEKFENRD